ncbi:MULTISPECIES: calcium/sodium antiporter [Cysteiniphilum]|uniref:calcium/sodium antiporter n=1 Tax=Cysteiniphilum TaxID=2056696 RepID=UPI0017848584|nr:MULTISPECIES: calcium/sodium antiporter [Cysteiniphilum]
MIKSLTNRSKYMLLNTFIVIISLIVVIYSAERLVHRTAEIASYFNISPLIIGMVILGFGTSSPEIVVAIVASLNDQSTLAIGNAIGSNVANMGLILGCVLLIRPIKTPEDNTFIKESAILLIITIFLLVIIYNLYLSRFDGIMLLIILLLLFAIKIFNTKQPSNSTVIKEKNHSIKPFKSGLWIVFYLLLLILGSKLLVFGATHLGQLLGMSDFVIGLIIIAIGTSIPELAASAAAVLKNQGDLAIGNIIGSNIFNILAVIGIATLIRPTAVSSTIIYRDMSYTALLTIFLTYLLLVKKGRVITRPYGAMLIISYILYIGTIGLL